MAEQSRGRSRLRDRPRIKLIALLGALAVGVGIYSLPSELRLGPGTSDGTESNAAQEQLTAAVERLFAADECPTASQASVDVQGIFTDLGFADWSVESVRGVTSDSCVTAFIDADMHRVVLTQAMSESERSALLRVRNASYDSCLTERQLTDMLTAVLAEMGQTTYSIETDGPLVAPTDRFQEVEDHLLSGCWVYSSTGLSRDGRRTFLIVGPPDG